MPWSAGLPLSYLAGANPSSPPISRRLRNARHTNASSRRTEALVVATPLSCTSRPNAVSRSAACTVASCCCSSAAIWVATSRSRSSARANRAWTAGGRGRRANPAPWSTTRPPVAHRRHDAAPRRQPPGDLIRQPRLLFRQRRALRTHVTRRLVVHAQHPHLVPHVHFCATDSHEHRHQLEASIRSVLVRRARRLTSMLDESTTRLCRPSCVNARWIRTHRVRLRSSSLRLPGCRSEALPAARQGALDRRGGRHWRRFAATASRQTPTSSPASSCSCRARMPHTTSRRLHYGTQSGSLQSHSLLRFHTPRSLLCGPLIVSLRPRL